MKLRCDYLRFCRFMGRFTGIHGNECVNMKKLVCRKCGNDQSYVLNINETLCKCGKRLKWLCFGHVDGSYVTILAENSSLQARRPVLCYPTQKNIIAMGT